MVSANTKDGRQTEENKRVQEEENNQYSQCWEGGGGAKLQSVLARMVSPGEVKPETVLILCIHIFSTGFGQFSSMYSIIEEMEEIFL